MSPSPPDFPPRTYNTSFSTSTSVISQSVLNDSCLSDKDRQVSVVSVFSSQSESGSFGHGNDESSSEDSESEKKVAEAKLFPLNLGRFRPRQGFNQIFLKEKQC